MRRKEKSPAEELAGMERELDPYKTGDDSGPVDEEIRFDLTLFRQLERAQQAVSYLTSYPQALTLFHDAVIGLDAVLSPYLPEDYNKEYEALAQDYWLKTRLTPPHKREDRHPLIIRGFLVAHYKLILKYAKKKGLLPKNMTWEF